MRKIFSIIDEYDFEKHKLDIKENVQYRQEKTLDDGSVYQGQWLSGKNVRHGMGITIYPNGDIH